MTEQQQRFEQAIDRLYQVFEVYPLQPYTGMCEHCYEPEEERKLHSKPLRELTAEDLKSYGWSALLTWGDVDDFKHFLPRLFELKSHTGWLGWVDSPVLFSKLYYAKWRDWPDSEQKAVEEYFVAFWLWFLADPEQPNTSSDLLCGIAQAVDDLSPFLQVWRSAGLVGQYLLADFVDHESEQVAKKRKLTDSFWQDKKYPGNPFKNDRTEQMNQVVDWLLEPSTRGALEQTFYEYMDDPQSADIGKAANILAWLAALYPPRAEITDQ